MPSRKYDARRRWVRHRRVRKTVSGTPERPRLSVFRSNKHTYAQVIDDTAGHTLAAASTADQDARDGAPAAGKVAAAALVGRSVAKRARAAGVRAVVLDRGGYKYHGRVKALAEAAREEGLSF